MADRDPPVETGEAAPLHPMVYIAASALVVGLIIVWAVLPVKEWLQDLTEWVRALGLFGLLVFILVYVVVTVVLAPAEVMSIAAGIIFGAWGIPVVVVAATIGASLAFLLARYLIRARVKALGRKSRVFAAVDKAVSEQGWKIVLLLRLNPLVPFGLQNYLFGATDIAVLPYAIATFFGIMPGAAMYVYLGILGHAAAGADSGSAGTMTLFAAGFVVTAITVIVIMRGAKAKLKELGMRDATGPHSSG